MECEPRNRIVRASRWCWCYLNVTGRIGVSYGVNKSDIGVWVTYKILCHMCYDIWTKSHLAYSVICQYNFLWHCPSEVSNNKEERVINVGLRAKSSKGKPNRNLFHMFLTPKYTFGTKKANTGTP